MIDIKLYKPYKKQKQVHLALEDSMIKFITVVAGRQAGKTMMGRNAMLMFALSKPNSVGMWVSPTSPQANKVYKQILNDVIESPMIKRYKGSLGDAEIEFKNGSVIKFRAAAQGDSLRGETIGFLVVDEAAMMEEDFINEVLLPMGLTVKGFKVLYITTPKGKNYIYTNYLKGMNDSIKEFKSFHFISSDSPYGDKSYIELVKANIPEKQFKQEWLAEFVDGASVFNEIGKISTLSPLRAPLANDKYFMGVDVALRDDYSVITVLNEKAEMVYMDRWNASTAPQVKERIIKAINLFKPKKILIESNGLGNPIIDDLMITHKIRNIIPWVTTNKSKNEIINNLINATETDKIKLLNEKVLIDEMEAYEMMVSKAGLTTFNGPSGFHDDTVVSLALAYECLLKNLYTGKIVFMG